MKNTSQQATTRTLADLYRSLDNQHAVTITYTKADGTETLRTIEPYEIRTTKTGNTIVRAMDRQSGEARSFRLDRIRSYTLHRSTYQVERPTNETETAPTAPMHSASALIAYELNRDTINAAYRACTALVA